METLLTQQILGIANTQTAHMDRLYDRLQQENARQQIQIQDLIQEVRSTVSARTPPTCIPTTMAHSLRSISDTRVTATAASMYTPK